MPFAALIPFESPDLAERKEVISPALKAASRAVSIKRTAAVIQGFRLPRAVKVLITVTSSVHLAGYVAGYVYLISLGGCCLKNLL